MRSLIRSFIRALTLSKKIPDLINGGTKLGWHGNRDWNDGAGTVWGNVASPIDQGIWLTRRTTSNEFDMAEVPAYKIPMLDGWYLVYMLLGTPPSEFTRFRLFYESGEAGELIVDDVNPILWAGGNQKAVVLANWIKVSGNFLELQAVVRPEGVRPAAEVRLRVWFDSPHSLGGCSGAV